MSRSRVYSGQRVETHEGRALSTLPVDKTAVADMLLHLGYPLVPVVTSTGERWKDGARKLREGDDDDDGE
jgi:hypothetical protein